MGWLEWCAGASAALGGFALAVRELALAAVELIGWLLVGALGLAAVAAFAFAAVFVLALAVGAARRVIVEGR